ncbi:MAG: glycosyltransferase family 4 protein [Phycisphaerales bacterium]
MTPNADALRIALYTPAWPGAGVPNGIVTYNAMLRPALAAVGVESYVLARSVTPGEANGDASVIEVRVPRRSVVRRVVGRVVERFRPGDYHAREVAGAIAGHLRHLSREHGVTLIEMEESFGLCGLVQDRAPVKVVARLHGPWFLNGVWQAEPATQKAHRIRREGAAIRKVAGVSAPSRDVLARTRAHYGIPLPHAVVIPNPIAVAPPHLRWTAESGEQATILFVGRFDNHKGGDVMLDAFARVAAARPDAILLFAGPHPGVVDAAGKRWEYAEYLARCFPDSTARERVRTLGVRTPDEIRALRRAASVVVVPSRYENFAYSLLEAASQGCPIVTTAIGGNTEIVQDGRNGLLARPEDPEDLARAILAILNDPPLCERLGVRALADCAERYDPALIARQAVDYYQQVLARR